MDQVELTCLKCSFALHINAFNRCTHCSCTWVCITTLEGDIAARPTCILFKRTCVSLSPTAVARTRATLQVFLSFSERPPINHYFEPKSHNNYRTEQPNLSHHEQGRLRGSARELTAALLDLRQREEDVETLGEKLRETSAATSDKFNSMQQELRQQSSRARKEAAEWKALAER